MKLIDALLNVNKIDSYYNIDVNELCSYVDINYYDIDYDKLNARLKAYWVSKHLCTDTWVGTKAMYLDDELIGMSTQSARKSPIEYSFISLEKYLKLKDFLLSLVAPSESDIDIISDEDLQLDIGDTYHVQFSNQILSKNGYYMGKQVKYLRQVDPKDYISRTIVVEDDEGNEIIINCNEFEIPYSVV
jgi:hypothetical protein